MLGMEIRSRRGVFRAELDENEFSDALWMSLPRECAANVWGCEIYFECPSDVPVKGDVSVLDTGDVAYWPEGDALCLFFGPTPLSGEDGRPVSAFPVRRIGRLVDDFSGLREVPDRTRLVLERAF